MDPVFEVWMPFLQTHSAILKKLEEELQAEIGIGLRVYDVLIQLRLAGGHLELSQLARKLLISNSGVTRLLDRMVKQELVERTPSQEDRRKISATLTKKGRALQKKASKVHSRGIEEHFLDKLDSEQLESLKQIFSSFAKDVN